jgi:hypothetical protein
VIVEDPEAARAGEPSPTSEARRDADHHAVPIVVLIVRFALKRPTLCLADQMAVKHVVRSPIALEESVERAANGGAHIGHSVARQADSACDEEVPISF